MGHGPPLEYARAMNPRDLMMEHRIRQRAYEIYQARLQNPALYDWLRAEREISEREIGSAPSALITTTSSLHSHGDQLSSLVHIVANKIQAAPIYIRKMSGLNGLAKDAHEIVNRYPGQSLAVAAILGFLLACVRGRD